MTFFKYLLMDLLQGTAIEEGKNDWGLKAEKGKCKCNAGLTTLLLKD